MSFISCIFLPVSKHPNHTMLLGIFIAMSCFSVLQWSRTDRHLSPSYAKVTIFRDGRSRAMKISSISHNAFSKIMLISSYEVQMLRLALNLRRAAALSFCGMLPLSTAAPTPWEMSCRSISVRCVQKCEYTIAFRGRAPAVVADCA